MRKKYTKTIEIEKNAPIYAKRLADTLNQNGLSQKDLSKLFEHDEIPVSEATLTGWLKGNKGVYTEPKTTTLNAVANKLGVSLDYLMGNTPNPTTDKDLDFVCNYTGLTQKSIEKIRKISQNNHVTTNCDSLSLLIEDDDFEYFLSLISGNMCDEVNEINVDIGKARTCIKSIDITDYSLSVSIRDISHRIKEAFDRNFPTADDKYNFLMLKREFQFVECLYQDNRITKDEYIKSIEELKKENSVL